ncbi:LysE family translocator [Desulfovibrio sp. JC010]|uniref:LysE family translocator n=1 Tax=Desulfovibrio sp. JC010 TaxID=2593641 RepID=UPI0013D04804|nr:LysE family translocator [Desulfovibrio sp. JC010]NDV27857.1 LysE family translocator [Desulfovibrio sp. JC010]
MLGIFFYCVGIMYTPGPVNILSLNRGLQSRFSAHIPFCMGVGTALFFWFALIGYTGSAVINDGVMPVISALGCGFILYLAYKIMFSDVGNLLDEKKGSPLKFRDGLLMQLLNPKSFLAVLPVTAVQFPAAGIEGIQITTWSIGLGMLGLGAPLAYAFAGTKVSRYIENPRYLKWFNYLMGGALIFAALDMACSHVYPALL